jgi:hypothetical protein
MNEIVVLRGVEARELLQTAIEKKLPAIMSYLYKGKWHVAKVVMTELVADRLTMKASAVKATHAINIRIDQPVGVSFKYKYGKFVFDTSVIDIERSAEATESGSGRYEGGSCPECRTVVLAEPQTIEVIQRRSYFRVNVPKSLKVNVLLWHRQANVNRDAESLGFDKQRGTYDAGGEQQYWQGRLVDVSAGGAQVALATEHKSEFRKGQFIGLTFTPLPYETPLVLDAQVRTILPTVDDKNVCLGLQIVGLEASTEGRTALSRLVGVVERYYQINQSSVRQQDMTPATNAMSWA